MKRNLLLVSMLTLGITIVMPCTGMESGDGQVENILETAILTSGKVEEIHQDGLNRRNKEFEQLNCLLTYIKEHLEKDEFLKDTVLQRLNEDKTCFDRLQTEWNTFKPGDGSGTTYQLTSNKMLLGIKGAIDLHKHFDDICDGNLPPGYSMGVPKANIFPNETHIYSTGRGIALKHLLMRTALTLLKVSGVRELEQIEGFSVTGSPFVHFTPLPKGLNLSPYEGSPYFVSEDNPQLAVIHNGYAFGAQRFEGKVDEGGPDDCSSIISKYYGIKYMTTTAEQYLAHQIGLETFYFDFLGKDVDVVKIWGTEDLAESWRKGVVKTWQEETKPKFSKDDTTTTILEQMEPLIVKSPAELQPGWVSAERRFANFAKNPLVVKIGAGGHTSIVLGTTGQDQEIKLWTLGANRDIEGQNMDFSYGIQTRPLFGDPLEDPSKLLVMYFKVR
jgi:hypothetical protein